MNDLDKTIKEAADKFIEDCNLKSQNALVTIEEFKKVIELSFVAGAKWSKQHLENEKEIKGGENV
jgi:hypothetical protein